MSGKVSLDERRRLVAESLQVGNPGNNARDLVGQSDPRTESQIELSIDEIRPYENNPRRAANAKFDDIEESIRTSGLKKHAHRHAAPASRTSSSRPAATALLALRQLSGRDARSALPQAGGAVSSPGDPKPRHHRAPDRERAAWRDDLLGQGVRNRRAEVATRSRAGPNPGLRPLEDALHALGLSVNTATLGLISLPPSGCEPSAGGDRSLGLDVKTIQPRLNALKRHAQARTSITDDELYAQVFEPVFRRFAGNAPTRGPSSVMPPARPVKS
ncbi:MAG: hypothetical protein IPG28_03285, partial [Betaproteobacteria bacterium]|nr:hypothetical protein [Betaproteobacteria bacterium]